MTTHDGALALHLARSHAVDALAETEAALAGLARLLGAAPGKETLGQLLVKMRALPAGPRLSKASRTALHALLADFEALLPARNDLVHAPLALVLHGGKAHAAFINPRVQEGAGIIARLMTPHDLERLATTARHLALRLAAVAQARPAPPPASG